MAKTANTRPKKIVRSDGVESTYHVKDGDDDNKQARMSAAGSAAALQDAPILAAVAPDETPAPKKKATRKRKKATPKQREAAKAKNKADKEALIADLQQNVLSALDDAIAAGEDGKNVKMPWRVGSPPRNVVTGNVYQGGNYLILGMQAAGNGEPDALFATYKQYQSAGLQVRKLTDDDPRYKILAPRTFKIEEKDANGNPVIDPKTGQPKFRMGKTYSTHQVFPLSQVSEKEGHEGKIDQLKEKYGPAKHPHERIERAEKVLDNCGIKTRDGSAAYYRPKDDEITMPPLETFETPEHYYGTRGHETVHATGHPDRLDRKTLTEYHNNHETRAKEELVAEFGAAMLNSHLGLDSETREDHMAYLVNWREAIADNGDVLIEASSKAGKAVEWIMAQSDDADSSADAKKAAA